MSVFPWLIHKDQSRLRSALQTLGVNSAGETKARLPLPLPVEGQPARLPAPAAPVNTAQTASQRPARRATLGDYKNALQRATAAGDEEAIAHFQGAIDKVLNQPTNKHGKPVPQGGSILNPIGQGLTFGFLDELAGVGGGLASAGRGALGLTPEGQKDGFWHGYDSIAGDIRQADKEYAERNPVASMAGEIGSGLVMPLGLLRTVGGGLKTALKTGAAYGLGSSDGSEKPDASALDHVIDRATGAATGAVTGAAGYGVLKGAEGIARAFIPRVNPKTSGPSFQASVRTLEDAGIPVTAAEKIGSKEGRMAERMTASYFGRDNAIEARPQTLYSKLMKMAGFDPEDARIGELSEEAVLRAKDRFSADYDRVLTGATVRLPDMNPRLNAINQEFSQLLPFEQKAAIRRMLDDFADQIGQNRQITGTDYKRLRSNLGKRAGMAKRSQADVYLAPVYKALQAAMDDAFRSAVHPARMAALRRIDRRYGNFKVLQDAARNPDALATLGNRAEAARGKATADFVKLATAYRDVFHRGANQSSGTAENLVATSLIPPISSMLRAAGSKASAATRNMRLPEPIASHLQGAVPFAVGQQAPGSELEELVQMIGGLR